MLSQEVPDDDDVRQTYNFAPGYYGLVYRADTPSSSQAARDNDNQDSDPQDQTQDSQSHQDTTQNATQGPPNGTSDNSNPKPTYKLQPMKWGLIPFWTKTAPPYASFMKTINCRDDSLATHGGMWQHVKQKKRCVVLAQGFYEWLKKNNGREKIPHYVKRKDGQLMCFAGLWDRVRFKEGEEGKDGEEVWSYTIITTSSNKQLGFLHDRMPVILENGSPEMFTWLDQGKQEWSLELQGLLKPFEGELECYPVAKEVGKVGNDSPSFVVPLDENKQSISNFFGNRKKGVSSSQEHKGSAEEKSKNVGKGGGDGVEKKPDEHRETQDIADAETNAPKPVAGTKHDREDDTTDAIQNTTGPDQKRTKKETPPSSPPEKALKVAQALKTSPAKRTTQKTSPLKSSPQKQSPNKSSQGSPKANDGSMKITNFFVK
ncbi:MAG: hypothetical protein Q9159_004140 [Coniocarpon cinnabarinum]